MHCRSTLKTQKHHPSRNVSERKFKTVIRQNLKVGPYASQSINAFGMAQTSVGKPHKK